MTWTHPLWDPPSREALKQGLDAVRRATAGGARTPREQGYIKAIAALYEDYETVPQAQRLQRYNIAMETLWQANKGDRNVTAFYALSILGLIGGDPLERSRRAAAVLEQTFGPAPDHPGAAHYLIHAYDTPEDAKKGLPAADAYAGMAPAIPHALHMPSHIYTRLGMWEKVARSNEAAWRASDDHVTARVADGGPRDFHSLQWLHYAYLQLGRYEKAAEILAVARRHSAAEAGQPPAPDVIGATYHLTDMSARDALERRDWKAAMDVPDGGGARQVDATRWFAHGVGAARAAWPGGLGPTIAVAREAATRLDALAATAGRLGTVELQRLAVLATIAAAQEEQDELTVLLTQATALDDTIRPGQPPVPVIPLRELAGDLYMLVHRYPDARREYEASLRRYAGRARSLHGLARAAARMKDVPAARASYRALLDLWKDADAGLPEMAEARAYLAGPGSPR